MDMLSLGCRRAPKEPGLERTPEGGAPWEAKHRASQKAPEKREAGSEEEKENGDVSTKPGGREVPDITAGKAAQRTRGLLPRQLGKADTAV